MISITVDVDWAPKAVLEDTIAILDRFDVSATVFSTHEDGLNIQNHERGLHPNYLGDERPDEEVLAELHETYPDAAGVRSHSLYTHSRLRRLYPEYGLEYESNFVNMSRKGVRPLQMPSGITQFPITFMDDVWIASRSGERALPDIGGLVDSAGLNVFTFHPVHIYLNTPTMAFYEANKEHYQEPETLLNRRADSPGVRDLFTSLICWVSASSQSTVTLSELTREGSSDSLTDGV